MSFKVLVYSCHSIIQIGFFYCIKKSISKASVFKTNSLEQVFSKDFDLFIFDVSNDKILQNIIENIVPFLKDKKTIFLLDNVNDSISFESNVAIFLNKNVSELELIKCIRILCKKPKKPIIRYKNTQITIKFSKRELQCANLLIKGYSVSQISEKLSLKLNTVSTYKKRIHIKTNTNNIVQLIKTLYVLKD